MVSGMRLCCFKAQNTFLQSVVSGICPPRRFHFCLARYQTYLVCNLKTLRKKEKNQWIGLAFLFIQNQKGVRRMTQKEEMDKYKAIAIMVVKTAQHADQEKMLQKCIARLIGGDTEKK